MRLSGFVTINGMRERIDWTLLGDQIVDGPGLSSAEVTLDVPMPEVVAAEEEAVVYEDEYEDLTVTDLRTMLSQRGEPVYGSKSDLINRLRGWDAANPEGYAEAEVEEETGEEVTGDESDATEE